MSVSVRQGLTRVLVRMALPRWFKVVPTIYVLSKKKKNFKHFLLKMFNVYNLKNLCILHGQVHYEKLPMQYTDIFKVVKNEKFQWKNFDIFLIFTQNIDCGYTLEPPR